MATLKEAVGNLTEQARILTEAVENKLGDINTEVAKIPQAVSDFTDAGDIIIANINGEWVTIKGGLDIWAAQTKIELALPIGTIITRATTDIPTGFLLCDGSELDRDEFVNLFNVASNDGFKAFGIGDSATTFTLPDLRGRFIRMQGGNSADFGVIQSDGLKSHNHTVGGTNSIARRAFRDGNIDGISHESSSWDADYSGMDNTGGKETRPVNIALNFLIKY